MNQSQPFLDKETRMKKPPASAAASAKPVEEPSSNLPIHTVRHRNIKAAIWRNQTEKGDMYNVTVSRSYREGEEWRDSHSFGYDDLMNLAKVLYDAHSHISSLRAKEPARSNTRRADRPPA